MKIMVCAKQVPDAEGIKKDPESNGIILEGVPEILNPYDGYALEAAARLKDKDPETKIVVLTAGPEKARAALKDCLGIAADKAYLAQTDKLEGADTLATARVLAAAIKKVEEAEGKFDAIFCGKQSADWESAQVGAALAELLGYPQLTVGLECEPDAGGLKVSQQAENGKSLVSISLPCLITFTQPGYDPRFPTIKRKMAANKAVIPVLSEAELGLDAACTAPVTSVKNTFAPAKRSGGLLIAEESMEENAARLASLLSEAHVI